MKIGVLVSGNGTNLQALLDAEAAGTLAPATIEVVISNRPGVPALDRATLARKPAVVVDHRGLAREAFEDQVLARLAEHGIEPPGSANALGLTGSEALGAAGSSGAIVLAGFMRVLTAHFV